MTSENMLYDDIPMSPKKDDNVFYFFTNPSSRVYGVPKPSFDPLLGRLNLTREGF